MAELISSRTLVKFRGSGPSIHRNAAYAVQDGSDPGEYARKLRAHIRKLLVGNTLDGMLDHGRVHAHTHNHTLRVILKH